ncbi:Thaumatin-like protein 1a [Gonioctena quinquepunctata]|nr:Thaumatin-like protein 1a [Gonioctena quinquepunctata]
MALVIFCALWSVNSEPIPLQTKGIQIKNKGNERLWIEMTNEDSFTLPSGQMASVILEHTWSGKIFARSDDCQVKKCNTPYTVAELSFDRPGEGDRYRVSIMDGFNIPIKIQPTGKENFCKPATCNTNIIKHCPQSHQLRDEEDKTTVVACRSYPELFKELCPFAVTSNEDLANNTFTCKTSNTYTVAIG